MQIFYAPGISGNEYTLDENESRHCIRVLRMRQGDPVRLIDGRGGLYEAVIKDADARKCTISVTGFTSDFEKRGYRLHMAISPLKNVERFEWFIEKSVEIGVDEITPLICDNTEKTGIKKERLNNLIISAMKQSLKSTITRLNDPCGFQDFVSRHANGTRMIAHCSEITGRSKIGDIYSKGSDCVLLIGPEGDFSADEIIAATGLGYSPVHLGKSRLRSETAGIAACYSIYYINQ